MITTKQGKANYLQSKGLTKSKNNANLNITDIFEKHFAKPRLSFAFSPMLMQPSKPLRFLGRETHLSIFASVFESREYLADTDRSGGFPKQSAALRVPTQFCFFQGWLRHGTTSILC